MKFPEVRLHVIATDDPVSELSPPHGLTPSRYQLQGGRAVGVTLLELRPQPAREKARAW